MRPNGGWSASGIQYMHSPTGQYSTHAGDPAQPVQHSLINARMCGFRLRLSVLPSDIGALLTTSPGSWTNAVSVASDTEPPCSRNRLQNYLCRAAKNCQ